MTPEIIEETLDLQDVHIRYDGSEDRPIPNEWNGKGNERQVVNCAHVLSNKKCLLVLS